MTVSRLEQDKAYVWGGVLASGTVWRAAFDRQGFAKITADEIRQNFPNVNDVRLLVKFDDPDKRPQILKDLNAVIIAVENGVYLIIRTLDMYQELPKPARTLYFSRERLNQYHFLRNEKPTSEARVGDIIKFSGMLESFFGTSAMERMTAGRFYSEGFDLEIRTVGHGSTIVEVKGVQIEIDALFENDEAMFLGELKNGLAKVHMRQLYYPMRSVTKTLERTGSNKPVYCFFVNYHKGCYDLYHCAFTDSRRPGSFVVVDSCRYILCDTIDTPVPFLDAYDRAFASASLADSNHPFPQANTLSLVEDLVERAGDEEMVKETSLAERGYDVRQADYYLNAGAYFGLLDKGDDGVWRQTIEGLAWADIKTPGLRNAHMLERFLTRSVFSRTLVSLRDRLRVHPQGRALELDRDVVKSCLPDIDTIASWISQETPLSGKTPARRASTVRSLVTQLVCGQFAALPDH